MKSIAQRITTDKRFELFIIAVIVFNGIILGLETSEFIQAAFGGYLVLANKIVIAIFVVEAALKIIAVAPKFGRYFGDGWNVFDFTIVVLSLLPATGEFATVARLARLLRVLRLISVIPELRMIISTLIKSIPSMGHVLLLMSVIFYIYGVAGYHLFHEHDPTHWRNLGISLLTLFRVVTLEDWTDVMYKAMEMNSFAWMYFVSFVVVGTFVVINLFIAVVLNNLDEAKTERLDELQSIPSSKEIMRELQDTQRALHRLEKRLNKKMTSEE